MKRLSVFIKQIFSEEHLLKNKKKTIYVGILIILLFNIGLYNFTDYHQYRIQYRSKTTGFANDIARNFFYFYYYTGNFPLATLNKDLKYSKDSAYKEIEQNGKDLIMEYRHWARLGENLRIICYYPNAIIKGSPENPRIKLFNTLIFILGLISVFVAFVRIGKPMLGIILVTIVNITPYFFYEIFINFNIFGLLASVFLIITGINLKLIFTGVNKKYLYFILPVISGIIIGFSSEIRGETSIVAGSSILIYILAKQTKYFFKIIMPVLLVLAMFSTKSAIKSYFDKKFEQTAELVAKHGGHVYTGKRISGHRFWHPVFCGLGDFDTKYGYEWNDIVAYVYAGPILKEKYNLDLNYIPGKYYIDEYYDKDSLYYKKHDEFEEYEQVVKEKVLHDIKNDPLWYITILFKRIIAIFTKTLPFPFAGWITLLLSIYLIKKKEWDLLKLIIISLPLSFTPFFIYSGDGTTYNSFFPILGVAILLYLPACKIFQNK